MLKYSLTSGGIKRKQKAHKRVKLVKNFRKL